MGGDDPRCLHCEGGVRHAPPPSLARADPSCSTSLPPVSGCPQSPPVVDDEAAFAVGVGTEEVPLPSERTRRAKNSLQSPAAPSSELIGSSDDGPPPSPSPPRQRRRTRVRCCRCRDSKDRAGGMRQGRRTMGAAMPHTKMLWEDPGGCRAIVPVESSSAWREQHQWQQAERMNGNALST